MKIALVNSRKPRRFDADAPWLRATMRLGREIAKRGDTLCTSVGTIGYECAFFGAAMGGGHIEAFVTSGGASTVAECLPPNASMALRRSIHSISIEDDNSELSRDKAVINAADLVIAVAIRAGGHMETLLQKRFERDGSVRVMPAADDDPLARGNSRLISRGMPVVDADLLRAVEEDSPSMPPRSSNWKSKFIEWKTSQLSGPTLAHFTRGADGPWPGQTRGEYLQDLWFGGELARRDGEAALRRILDTCTLQASSRLIRGGFRVISFTAAPPERMGELYRYRPHLVRWDFEPFGIVFDREWLESRGARPVRYLPSDEYRGLSADERPYFQKHEPPRCDYSMEEEWRIIGDLDFSNVASSAVRIISGA